jgi:hypothetical protein
MKKIIFLVASLIMLATISPAQQSKIGDYTKVNSGTLYASAQDTVSGTATDTFFAPVQGKYSSVTFQMSMTKMGSNTVAGNLVYLYGSTYNGGYNLLYSDTAKNQATQQFSHPLTGNPYSYYMTVITGITSQQSAWLGRLLLR